MNKKPKNDAAKIVVQRTDRVQSSPADHARIDGRTIWRLAALGLLTTGSVTLAIYVLQSAGQLRQDHRATLELLSKYRTAEQAIAENQQTALQLSSTVGTLGEDRDRLFTRMSALEASFETLSASVRQMADRQAAAEQKDADRVAALEVQPARPAPPQPSARDTGAAAQSVSAKDRAPRATEPPKVAEPVPSERSPQPVQALAAARSVPTGTSDQSTDGDAEATASIPASRTTFGIELGRSRTMEGLQSIWRRALNSDGQNLAALRPVIATIDKPQANGARYRLVAGPFVNAAEAARGCAALLEKKWTCSTAVYEGTEFVARPAPAVAAARPLIRDNSRPSGQETTRPDPAVAATTPATVASANASAPAHEIHPSAPPQQRRPSFWPSFLTGSQNQ